MYQIWFTAYNEGEMWDRTDFGPNLPVEHVWDEYRDRMVMQDVGVSEHQIVSARDLRKSMHEFADSKVLFDGDDGEHGDLFVMQFKDLDEARLVWRAWMRGLRQKEAHRGADDGTYDYYPDAWRVAWQLAQGLDVVDEYRAAVKELRENTEYGDPGGDLFDLIEE